MNCGDDPPAWGRRAACPCSRKRCEGAWSSCLRDAALAMSRTCGTDPDWKALGSDRAAPASERAPHPGARSARRWPNISSHLWCFASCRWMFASFAGSTTRRLKVRHQWKWLRRSRRHPKLSPARYSDAPSHRHRRHRKMPFLDCLWRRDQWTFHKAEPAYPVRRHRVPSA